MADDNADMREYLRRLLSPHYTVEVVPNGAAALAAAREHIPDLVLTDVMMPELDGFELLHALRADERTREVPVILLSARAGEETRLEGLAAGADDYLVKPFALDELVARLEALHRRASRQVTAAPLRIADLEYNPATLTATRGGQRLEMSATLRQLLEYLLRHQDRVVTRSELCELIWGDSDVDALRGHIHELRLVVDRPFAKPLLHTVRGGGWRLMEHHG